MCSRVVVWFVLLAGVPALSSAQTKSVWAGVYTDAQAARGEAVYRRICSLCHGPTLEGTESAPELRGSALFKPYYGKPVADLFTSVRDKMPKDAPGTLTPQQVADVLAYVFRANKMPAGPDEIGVSAAALSGIVIAPRPQ